MLHFSDELLRELAPVLVKLATELTPVGREHIKDKNFVFPAEKKYPIHDRQHAESALGFSKMHGSTEVQAKVRAAVEKKYPGIGLEKKAVSTEWVQRSSETAARRMRNGLGRGKMRPHETLGMATERVEDRLHDTYLKALNRRTPKWQAVGEGLSLSKEQPFSEHLKSAPGSVAFSRDEFLPRPTLKEAAAPKKEKRRPWNVANIRSGKRPMSVDTMLKKEKDGTLNVKLGSSRLRKAIQFVEEHDPPRKMPFGGLSTGNRYFSMNLGDKPIGHIQLAEHAPGTKGHAAFGQHQVISSGILPEYRGLGLGSKMYGDVMKRLPGHELSSDSVVSDSAAHVWDRMGKHRGYQLSKNPMKHSSEAQHQFGLDRYSKIPQHTNETASGYIPAFKAKLNVGSAVPTSSEVKVVEAQYDPARTPSVKLSSTLAKLSQFFGPSIPFTDSSDRGAAPAGRRRMDSIPSREEVESQTPKREDGRSFTTTDVAPGTRLFDVATTNSPQERTT